jgi:hypothetical protein
MLLSSVSFYYNYKLFLTLPWLLEQLIPEAENDKDVALAPSGL